METFNMKLEPRVKTTLQLEILKLLREGNTPYEIALRKKVRPASITAFLRRAIAQKFIVCGQIRHGKRWINDYQNAVFLVDENGNRTKENISYGKLTVDYKEQSSDREVVINIKRTYQRKRKVKVIVDPKHSCGLSGLDFTREKVRIRDNHTCQICGKVWIVGKRRFDVHHKDLDSEKTHKYDIYENEKENLITLCHKCHLNVHHNNIKL